MISNHCFSLGGLEQTSTDPNFMPLVEAEVDQHSTQDYFILPEVSENWTNNVKAGNAIRTRDIHLGKVTLYH